MTRTSLAALLLTTGIAAGCNKTETVVLTDAMNYAFVSTISADAVQIPSGEDAVVDWSGLTRDILGTEMDPTTEVTQVNLVLFGDLTRDEVLEAINNDELRQSDVAAFAEYVVQDGETSARLSQFSAMGTPVVPSQNVVAGMGTFLASVVTTQTLGAVCEGEAKERDVYRMFQFFDPTEGAQAAEITITSTSATLDYDVDIDGVEPIRVSNAKDYEFDWSELTQNGADHEIELSDIDELLLGSYQETIDALEQDFLQVENLADTKYEADVEGVGSETVSYITQCGDAFPGFDNGETWLLALRCTTCVNPAPPFVGVVEIE